MEIAQIKAFNKNVDSFIDKLLPELEEIYKSPLRKALFLIQSPKSSYVARIA